MLRVLLTRADWDQADSRDCQVEGDGLLHPLGTGHHLGQSGCLYVMQLYMKPQDYAKKCLFLLQYAANYNYHTLVFHKHGSEQKHQQQVVKCVCVSINTRAVAVFWHALLLLIFCYIRSVTHLHRCPLPFSPTHAAVKTKRRLHLP